MELLDNRRMSISAKRRSYATHPRHCSDTTRLSPKSTAYPEMALAYGHELAIAPTLPYIIADSGDLKSIAHTK